MTSAIKLKNQVTKLEAAKKAATKGKNTKLAAKFQSQIEVLKGQIKALNKPTGSPAVQAAKQLAREYKAKYGVSFNGVDIEKDALVPAFKTGRRVSQGIKGNQFASKGESKGHVYYEYRENRIDRNAKRYPKLADGGVMAKGGMTPTESLLKELRKLQRDLNSSRLQTYREGDNSQEAIALKKERQIKLTRFNEVLETLRESNDKYANGGMMAKGGKLDAGVYRVGRPTKVSPMLYEQKIVEIFDNGDIATASDYGRKLGDFKSQKYPIISNERLEEQYKKFARGGVTEDVYVVYGITDVDNELKVLAERNGYKSAQRKIDQYIENGLSEEFSKMGTMPKSKFEKEKKYLAYAHGGVIMTDVYGKKDGKKVKINERPMEIREAENFVKKQGIEKYYTDIDFKYLPRPMGGYKYADGGSLDSILLDTGGASVSNVGGTFYSNADLTPQMDITNPMFKKGGTTSPFKYEIGDKVMVNDSGYVKSFDLYDLTEPATIIERTLRNKYGELVDTNYRGKTLKFYKFITADGDTPIYVVNEENLSKAMFEHGGETHRGEVGSMFAIGGMTKHGLKVGDTILQDKGYAIVVKGKNGEITEVELNTGMRG